MRKLKACASISNWREENIRISGHSRFEKVLETLQVTSGHAHEGGKIIRKTLTIEKLSNCLHSLCHLQEFTDLREHSIEQM